MTAADAPQVADLSTQLGYPASAADTSARIAALEGRWAALVADVDGRAVGWVHVALVTSLVAGL